MGRGTARVFGLAAIRHKHYDAGQPSTRAHVLIKRTLAGIRRRVAPGRCAESPAGLDLDVGPDVVKAEAIKS